MPPRKKIKVLVPPADLPEIKASSTESRASGDMPAMPPPPPLMAPAAQSTPPPLPPVLDTTKENPPQFEVPAMPEDDTPDIPTTEPVEPAAQESPKKVVRKKQDLILVKSSLQTWAADYDVRVSAGAAELLHNLCVQYYQKNNILPQVAVVNNAEVPKIKTIKSQLHKFDDNVAEHPLQLEVLLTKVLDGAYIIANRLKRITIKSLYIEMAWDIVMSVN